MNTLEWLKTLKVGDEVCYDARLSISSRPEWVIVKVAKITPTGRINTDNGMQFINGVCNFGKSAWDAIYNLEPGTDKIKSFVEEQKYRAKVIPMIKNIRWDILSTEILERVLAIIEGKKRIF